ncbi:MAG TPA: gluconate 2-dehydrogenase subunit 3 family protein [Myxococcota bacterium]|nr:gluconate 2-dehydrogenase subunit 3 family protein [Myxococcota bacterium]HRY95163.1 gluconate 2-dehydrogenase subunit 3 family protein [Myxococcota bacterium]HSA20916.1 gluconate 2-dehydrogenase subunit 3 family protein [Myxococcota bacterium]
MNRFSRRAWICGLLGLGAAGLWPRRVRPQGHARAPAPLAPGRSPFDARQRRALAAACERVLPGAGEAGVPGYLDRQLAREPFSRFLAPTFGRAAELLDSQAREAHGQVFAELPAEAQDAILGRFQAGAVQAQGFQARPFFEHLVRFCLEGFLGDPRHGGNRAEVGWRFIGHHPCWWSPRRIDSLTRRGRALPY